MKNINWDYFWSGVLGAFTLFLLGALIHAGWGVIYNRIYNEGYERGVEVGTVCPNNRSFHCPIGDK